MAPPANLNKSSNPTEGTKTRAQTSQSQIQQETLKNPRKRLNSPDVSPAPKKKKDEALDEKMDQLLSNQAEILGHLKQIKTIQTQLNNLSETVTHHASEINVIKTNLHDNDYKVNSVATKVDQLQLRTDHMEYEIRKINLTIVGVVEDAEETSVSLKAEMESWFSSLTRKEIKIDCATRFGIKKRNKPRTIKVKFLNHDDRNTVYSTRFNTTHPVYINEDLPPPMFKTLMTLKEKAKALRQAGVDDSPKINLFKMTVQTNKVLYTLNGDNEFEETDCQMETDTPSQSNTARFLGEIHSNTATTTAPTSTPQPESVKK